MNQWHLLYLLNVHLSAHFQNGAFEMWWKWIFGAKNIIPHFLDINLNKNIMEANLGKVNFYRDKEDATDSLCINF